MTWEVFLSPHSDDESIGMAGAITRAHLAGMQTLVVLVTDNVPSTRQTRLFAERGISVDLAASRRVEWRKAMACLLVDETQEWEIPESEMAAFPRASQQTIEQRLDIILRERLVAHVHTTLGAEDIHAEVGYGSLAHMLCAHAVAHLAPAIALASLHGVYVYSKGRDERTDVGGLPIVREPLSRREIARKREALDCYRASADTIGYGYASVPELIDGADADPHEYVVELRR